MRAKLEQDMGLTNGSFFSAETKEYWSNEPLIPERYLEARKKATSSNEFIEKHKELGYQKSTNSLLFTFQIVSVLLAICLLSFWVFTRWEIQELIKIIT